VKRGRTTKPAHTRLIRWLAGGAGLLLWISAGLAPGEGGSPPKFREYEIKAAFLLNFLQFVEWPAAVASNSAAPMVIGILGEDPFGAVLDENIKGESVHGRPLAIKRERKASQLKDCQLVFIARSEKGQLKDCLNELRGASVLTVSDLDSFCRQGGMIALFNEGGKVRFEINQTAALESKLKISSKLLRLGRPMGK
jgi:hypothetical protein